MRYRRKAFNFALNAFLLWRSVKSDEPFLRLLTMFRAVNEENDLEKKVERLDSEVF